MVTQTLTGLLAAALTVLHGCAVIPDTASHRFPMTTTTLPAADPALDHYIAWVPQEKAKTAAVARALTHISLGNAREQTVAELCSDDARVINNKVTGSVGPLRTQAPLTAGGYPAWYYRISQQPGLHGCAENDSHRFYQVLQANLPVWMSIRTAAPRSSATLDLPE